MPDEAIFYRGMYEYQLEQMLDCQNRGESVRLFIQPYSKRRIVKLAEDPPTAINPVTFYLSTTDNLHTVSWRAEIIDWQNKQELDHEECRQIDREIKEAGYDSGLYGIDEGMINLLQLRNLVNLDSRFSVSELSKTNGREPVSDKPISSGWVYVQAR